MEEYVRKMASIQTIDEVKLIPDADKICAYVVQGFNVIDQIGKYSVGDKVVFIQPDSFVPNTLAPFLTKPGKFPKVFNEVEGEKIRTIRLRGVYSQGLILPLEPTCQMIESVLFTGLDVSLPLGIQKWEPPPEFSSADARGLFPDFIRKTDQERVNTFYKGNSDIFETETFECSEKCEGSSHTAYFYQGVFGVASRNLDLKRSDENTYWKTALDYDLENKLTNLGRNIAIQSEICGPKISGDIYKLSKFHLFVFDIFDIDKQEYLNPVERRELTKELGLVDAPVLHTNMTLAGKSLEDILVMADGTSVLGTIGCLREGLVFKANYSSKRISFKSVSRKYLAKQDSKE